MSKIEVDTVAEKTSANGVTVDGLNIKDSKLVTANSVVETNLTDNIVTLAKMASGTDGNIISYDASGNPVAIATGNDGQVLTSTGAGSPPAFETLPVGGITMADQWRVSADFTGAASPISSNLERVDTSGQGTIGSAMTVSSGVFTFPVTGIYKIEFNAQFTINDNTRYYINYIESSRNNGSSWTQISENASFIQQTDSNFTPQSLYTCSLFDCADTSNHKVRFRVLPVNTSTTTYGNTAQNETFFTFIRLGDT